MPPQATAVPSCGASTAIEGTDDLPLTPDETLVKATLAGDEAAFAELYRRHVGRITGYVRNRVRDMSRWDDVVQETFVQAFMRLDEFDREPGSFRQWLIGAVARYAVLKCFTAQRRDIRMVELVSEQAGVEGFLPGEFRTAQAVDADAETDVSTDVRELLARLSPNERDVIELAVLEGKSRAVVAEELGISEASVKAVQSKALRRMRGDLPPAPGRPEPRGPRPRAGGVYRSGNGWRAEMWAPDANGVVRRWRKHAPTWEAAEAERLALCAELLPEFAFAGSAA